MDWPIVILYLKGLYLAEQLVSNGNSAKGTTDCEQLAFKVNLHYGEAVLYNYLTVLSIYLQ